jgi:hypothetical protein
MGAQFARRCSVVLGSARPCSLLTWAERMSRRSGEWWRQSLQARGHWFESPQLHLPQVSALLVSSGEAGRRVSTSCQESVLRLG